MKRWSLQLNENGEETLPEIRQEFPYCMKQLDYSLYFVPWHWHEEVEFVYIEQGSQDVITSNYTYTIRAGEAYFINSNVLTSKRTSPGAESTKETAHLFHPILLAGYFRSVYQTKYLDPILKNSGIEVVIFRTSTEAGREFLKKIRKLGLLQKQENTEFEIRNLLSEMWQLLLREIQDNRTAEHTRGLQNEDRIRYMLSYIGQHYSEKITLKELADSASISERETIRCFQKNVGKTPFEYLSEFRVNRSRQMLGDTDKPVTEIALECGFSDSSYFGKIFRKYIRMTPKQYRDRCRRNAD